LSVFTPGGKVKSRKEQRVVDHFIFERFTPPRGAWRLKEKVETTMPEFLVVEPKAEKEDGARPGARTVAAGRGARR